MRMIKRGNFQAGFAQRFGFFSLEEKKQLRLRRWIWIRSISVGETLVALKLARAMHAAEPALGVVLSTTTSTGHAIAKEAAQDWLFPICNPFDAQSAVERTLNAIRPEKLVLIEGELWPNLMAECARRDIPVLLANARLSQRSAARFAKFQKWTAPFFRMLQWVGVPDEADAQRWAQAGVPSKNIAVTGSIKFDQDVKASSRAGTLRQLLLDSDVAEHAPIVLAGSTHNGEEALLLECFKHWRTLIPDLRLLIAPRHVERVPELLTALAASQIRIALRSQLPTTKRWEVLILNTTGELRDWYELATVAFVGKSLTAHGGQNPVEPALAGKPVVFGPHMENFEGVVKLLLSKGGAIQVADVEELRLRVAALLKDSNTRSTMGAHAIDAIRPHQGSTLRTVDALMKKQALH
jgi:3-deoxy-D-manno-octulosonic-acid transferase